MTKIKKNDILIAKFKLKYRVIFSNKLIKEICKKHFDSKMGFAIFIVGLVQNQLGENKALKHVQINASNWIKMLTSVYDDKTIQNTYEKLQLNPIIHLENIEKYFDCFDVAINKIINFFEIEQLDLKINSSQLKYLLKSSFGYIMYNCINCKLPYNLEDILKDPEYDQKFIMILNNTKLFAKAKNAILNNCGLSVSNIISLLLGISNDLSEDK